MIASNSKGDPVDHTANFFWLLVLFLFLLLGLWWFEKLIIIKFIFFIRHCEIVLIEWVVNCFNAVATFFYLPRVDLNSLHVVDRSLSSYGEDTPFSDIVIVSQAVGCWLSYPFALILLMTAGLLFFREKGKGFRSQYTMNTLKEKELGNWPQITPIAHMDLLKLDLNDGQWAMAKRPFEYCQEHQLLLLCLSETGEKTWSITKHAAERHFILQMGALWNKEKFLPIYVKALFVIFMAKILKKKELSYQMGDQIAKSATDGQLDFSGVEMLFRQYKKHKIINLLEKKHAYVGTLIASLLELARKAEVLASVDFIWLKAVDRRLWYLLNSIGRRVCFVECAALFAHWLYEKGLGHAIVTPHIAQAVQALELEVKNILYQPEIHD